MGTALQHPIELLRTGGPVKCDALARQNFQDIFENALAVCFGRPQGKDLTESGAVQYRIYAGISKQPFDFRGKYKGFPGHGVKQRFDAQPVTEQTEFTGN